MKRKITILFVTLVLSLFLTSCGGLSAPEGLAIDDRLLTWNDVRGADGYRVLINEEDEVDVEDNQLLLADEYFGSMSFKVASMAGEALSAYSAKLDAEVFLHLDAPENVQQDGDLLLWDEVPYSEGYVVKVGSVEYPSSVNQYQITTAQPIEVSVLANGSEDGYVIASAYSDPIWFKTALASPTNITYLDGVLSWSAVTNAASYLISINNGIPFSSPSNQYEIGYDYVGSILFKVKAISGNEQYLDSAYGEVTIQINPLTLVAPQNLSITDDLLSFDNVEHAMSYGIYHNGEFIEEIATNGYTIPNAILTQSGSYLQVQALSTIHNDSELSTKVYLGESEIDSEDDLRAMTSTGYYVLTADIVLTEEWTPLAFSGVFDGGNHEISGLAYAGEASNHFGLFSELSAASIYDLRIVVNYEITTTNDNLSVGGLAGVAENSLISNVAVSGELEVVSNNGISNIGGLFGSLNGGSVSGARTNMSISGTNVIAGGLIGKISSSTSSTTTIANSGSQGQIIVLGGEQTYVGGLLGMLSNNNASITSSRSLMNVSGTSYVGGFVGYMGLGSISNSYSRGIVTASSNSLVHAGGFVGRIEGYNNRITYSIAMASISIAQTGANIHVGSFSGITPGGSYASIYSNCHYDSTLSSFDRIGNPSNGKGDGISGLSSGALLTITTFSQSVWSFSESYPTLSWES